MNAQAIFQELLLENICIWVG